MELREHQMETLKMLGCLSDIYEIAVGELIELYIEASKQLIDIPVKFSPN